MQRLQHDVDLTEFIGKQESQSIISLSGIIDDEVIERHRQGVKVFGDPTPWGKLSEWLRFRPCETTLWAGYNGHGKSMVLSQCTAVWVGLGPLIQASLEMPISALGERFARQARGTGVLTDRDFEILKEGTKQYWIYDETDSVASERIIGMAAYAAKVIGCRHIVIDSMVKCGVKIGENSAEDQKNFVDRLCWVAKRYKTHIHLVHHMRKGRTEHEPGDKMDVKGAGEITDLVDNVMLCWRNKPKEKTLDENPQDLSVIDEPDMLLTVAKQRHGEWEGVCKLWFDAPSRQFVAERRMMPVEYIGGSASDAEIF